LDSVEELNRARRMRMVLVCISWLRDSANALQRSTRNAVTLARNSRRCARHEEMFRLKIGVFSVHLLFVALRIFLFRVNLKDCTRREETCLHALGVPNLTVELRIRADSSSLDDKVIKSETQARAHAWLVIIRWVLSELAQRSKPSESVQHCVIIPADNLILLFGDKERRADSTRSFISSAQFNRLPIATFRKFSSEIGKKNVFL